MHSLSLLVVAATLYGQVQPSEFRAKRDAFKQKMMPSVGKVVTVTGTLSVGKIAEFIATNDGGAVYMMSSDTDKIDGLLPLLKKRLAVTGTLQFAKEVPPPRSNVESKNTFSSSSKGLRSAPPDTSDDFPEPPAEGRLTAAQLALLDYAFRGKL